MGIETRLQVILRYMEEWFFQIEQRLVKVDTLSNMVDGISNLLSLLIHKKDNALNNLGRYCREGHHFTHHLEDYSQDLVLLWQHGTFTEFNDEFDAISCKFCLSERFLVDVYMAGLQEEYVSQVCLFKPRIMRQSCSLACLQEIKLQRHAKRKTLTKNTSCMTTCNANIVATTQDKLNSSKNALVGIGSQSKSNQLLG